ncbi:MAG: hypothetical protein A2622_07500 [Bdellovibrionales bacterium RIFCSPHIGHO2_01_FULL_40_29]|nr:MAG: hypothetical protein A2622_07500 [Bdellovibrionales bacterium RIFCSPHIGHO2_01_FULL_40_29]OFZ34232.1 MAG: hypothetical protein A3D17_04150 [Bdellovibrionales bacterium RIFCSPHIGHO2_02_FULL_40_15]
MKTLSTLLGLSLIGSISMASTFNYTCYGYFGNGDASFDKTMILTTDTVSAKADIIGESWDKIGGKLNPNYKSKSNLKYLKYGSQLILEESLTVGGRQLNDGSYGGLARVEGEVEGGFVQLKFICKR